MSKYSKIVVGKWDCKQCGEKGISGKVYKCTSCGRTRSSDTKFYLSGAMKEAIYKNEEPDWCCSHCGGLNISNSDTCKDCGNEKDAHEDLTYFDKIKQKERKIKQKEQRRNWQRYDDWVRQEIVEKKRPKRNWFVARYILFGLVILLGFLNLIYYVTPKEYSYTVLEKNWQYKVYLEKYKTVTESGWDLPITADILDVKRKVHHYEQVYSHTETRYRTVSNQEFSHYQTEIHYQDLGNGTFGQYETKTPVYRTVITQEPYQHDVYVDEPVYQDYYIYNIDRWVPVEPLISKGTNHSKFYYKEPLLSETLRETGREEIYTLLVRRISWNKPVDSKVLVTKEDFTQLKEGDTITGTLSSLTGYLNNITITS